MGAVVAADLGGVATSGGGAVVAGPGVAAVVVGWATTAVTPPPFSGSANQAAGHAVGANAYVVKNDFNTLVGMLKELLGSAPLDAVSA